MKRKRAVIKNRIYIDVDNALSSKLDKELSYKLLPLYKGGFPTYIKNHAKITPSISTIPSGRTDLIPDDYEIIDKRDLIPASFPDIFLSLRPSQQYVYDNVNDSCIINAPVSWGKTFTALAIAKKLGQKTLVVTHTTVIRDQWVKEVKKMFGFIPSVIGGGKFVTTGSIVISNIQTLIKHLPKITEGVFGTLIVDEAHHVPATTFTKVVDKMNCRYKIGLTGTLERKDRKHVIFSDYFTKTVFKPSAENYMPPKQVTIIKTNIPFVGGSGGSTWSSKVTDLSYNENYRTLLVEVAKKMADKGHKVLVVCERTNIIEACAERIGPRAAYVTGEIKNRDEIHDKLINDEIDILFGTYNIYSEGISLNPLSCLIVGIQTNNKYLLTQLIGRVTRLYPDKLQPEIIDINLKGDQAKRQSQTRLAFYAEMGYKIRTLES